MKYSKEQGPWIFYRLTLYYRELYGEDGVVRWAKKWKVDAIIAQLKDVDVEKGRRFPPSQEEGCYYEEQ